jgi:hypothetical protein
MSAEIIQFVPRARLVARARHDRELGPASTVSCFSPQLCDLTMDHADTAPCEYAPIYEQEHDDAPA